MYKVVCISKEHNNTVYEGIVIGEIYDVIAFYSNVAPNGRIRVKGKFEDQRIISDLYPIQLFITLEQHRENQLNKLI